jgi:hypothetical protein
MKLRTIGYASIIAVAAIALAIGSATTGEAKGKKKSAAAAPAPAWCPFVQPQPVCAVKGKQKFTYADACFAAKDGAKVVSNKACATKSGKKSGKKRAAKKKM